MYLKSLSLQNFRNYRKKFFDFSGKTTLLVGKNGSGKTNILEAIYLLATGRSFRATKNDQMILYGEELARVMADIRDDGLEIVLTVGEVQGQKAQKSKYLLNGVAKRKMDFVGNLKCVLFRPEDIDLVLGTPSGRREYLNSVLEQVNREYRRSLLAYKKGLRQRNKLLTKIREGEADKSQLLFWNKLLIKNGQLIFEKRKEYIEFINKRLKKKSSLQLFYDKSLISEKRLDQYSDKEVWAGKTLVGPHRDEFMFILQRKGRLKKDLAIYGSRGEQRMAVFQVKLNELEFVSRRQFSGPSTNSSPQSFNKETPSSLAVPTRHSAGSPVKESPLTSRADLNYRTDLQEERPMLLLDDVFSELDSEHRREVFKLLDKQQTIITTADERLIPKKYLKKVEVMKL
ncbi:MAG: DNA replication and repair protein RecF [Patescibacteria group bacterium]|nr:DNA replication and repair protein RecF [Patescibacteria group bacterium]